jgi:hypothetical protein
MKLFRVLSESQTIWFLFKEIIVSQAFPLCIGIATFLLRLLLADY